MYQPNLDCQGSPNVSDELELDEVEGLLVLKWTCDRVPLLIRLSTLEHTVSVGSQQSGGIFLQWYSEKARRLTRRSSRLR